MGHRCLVIGKFLKSLAAAYKLLLKLTAKMIRVIFF